MFIYEERHMEQNLSWKGDRDIGQSQLFIARSLREIQ